MLSILKDNLEVWKDIKRERITMDIYTSEPSSDDKYFSMETWEKLFDMLNRKTLTKISDYGIREK